MVIGECAAQDRHGGGASNGEDVGQALCGRCDGASGSGDNSHQGQADRIRHRTWTGNDEVDEIEANLKRH